MQFTIKYLLAGETDILKDLLYEAIFIKENEKKPPQNIIYSPEIYIYIEDFGKENDFCFIATVNGKAAGGIWARILSGTIKGFGNIDNSTPEIAIAVFEEYRKRGIGTALLKRMLQHLKEKDIKKVSLSVHKNNYAVKMYRALGFTVISEKDKDYIMLLNLNRK